MVEIPNIEFHELSDTSVRKQKSHRCLPRPYTYPLIDNLPHCGWAVCSEGYVRKGRNNTLVTPSTVEGDKATSTGQVSL
jgi:hypothetical protein